MRQSKKSGSPLALILPLAVSLLVICVAAGYCLYHFASERAYRERWKDYNECGLA